MISKKKLTGALTITPKKFYTIGRYLFFMGGVIGLIRVIDLWSVFKSYDAVGAIGSMLFQFLLFGFFSYLNSQEDYKEADEKDVFKMNEVLEKLNLEEEEKNAKKK